jgi:hypothetical protein
MYMSHIETTMSLLFLIINACMYTYGQYGDNYAVSSIVYLFDNS